MKKVYISRNYKNIHTAGSKAKTDMEQILQSIDYKNIGFKQSRHQNKIKDYFLNLFGIVRAIIYMPGNRILFLQYPMKKYYYLVCTIAQLRGCKVIALIHDLGSFRRKKLTVNKEMKRLKKTDYIIALNSKMAEWLKENGFEGGIGSLGIWDYLSENENNSPMRNSDSIPYIVNYAGGLSRRKNAFLYELENHIESYNFHLYGGGFDRSMLLKENRKFLYQGFMHSNDLIKTMQGDFGLVWDGDSIETCSGSFGTYLKYNNPHKVSLYIRCHLPIIIWKEAALAPYIEEKGIGIAINSLEELNWILSALKKEEYNEMKKNVIEISGLLQKGFYLKEAEKEAIKYFSSYLTPS